MAKSKCIIWLYWQFLQGRQSIWKQLAHIVKLVKLELSLAQLSHSLCSFFVLPNNCVVSKFNRPSWPVSASSFPVVGTPLLWWRPLHLAGGNNWVAVFCLWSKKQEKKKLHSHLQLHDDVFKWLIQDKKCLQNVACLWLSVDCFGCLVLALPAKVLWK